MYHKLKKYLSNKWKNLNLSRMKPITGSAQNVDLKTIIMILSLVKSVGIG
jgi:hypothetical protein